MNPVNPVVSVYCMTYNHENYIRDCLDGFLMQKTTFPFEVIVHDDASTDRTQEIIREYAEKYPDIIRPIYQKENQRRLKVSAITTYVFPEVRGKYVAICEGDDYWTDEEKLQKQIEIMDAHPECHFCVCGVQEVSVNKTPLGVFHPAVEIKNEIIDPEDFIVYSSKYSFQTSSYLMRYTDWAEYITKPPAFKHVSNMGDITIMLYFGSLGKTAYIDRVMSCYRRGAPSSFSADRNRWSVEKRISHFEKQLKVWTLFDEFSAGRYHSTCAKKVSDLMFGYCILRYDAKELLKAENREYFAAYPLAKKLFVLVSCCFKKTMKTIYLKVMNRREEKKQALWENS